MRRTIASTTPYLVSQPIGLSNTNEKFASTLRMSSVEGEKSVNVRVKGVVQGVFYRRWTVEKAQQLGLKGWVRNRRDGSVEAVFSGKAVAVDDMVESCRGGPPSALVTALDVTPSDPPPGETFELKPTL